MTTTRFPVTYPLALQRHHQDTFAFGHVDNIVLIDDQVVWRIQTRPLSQVFPIGIEDRRDLLFRLAGGNVLAYLWESS